MHQLLIHFAATKGPQIKIPNAETRAAMAEAEEMIRQRRARFSSADDLFTSLEEAAAP
jgi:DNA-damage-inducible protein J